ncbi:MAG: protoporphyrinogen oxidase [Ilumatobacteraceae bacterium]
MSEPRQVVIIGGGVAGLTSALTVLTNSSDPVNVTVLEAESTVGGRIRTSQFAGLSIDEGPDAFLARVPWATQLASELGLGASMTSPTDAHASIWHNGMHDIPGDLMLGVPAKVRAFATSGLISPLGKLRAAIEPLLPTTTDTDSIGEYVRSRFGNQIQDRLVDPLIGSIYATDSDNFSMAAVPQIAALTASRSMLLAAGRARAAVSKAPAGPIFSTPIRGIGALIELLTQRVTALGGHILTGESVSAIEKVNSGYTVSTSRGEHHADAIVIASPAKPSSQFVRPLDARAADLLGEWSHASVVLITMAIPASQWPARLTGSGYLVPKPDQRWVSAASFGSNKWAHWRPDDGSMILRVSLGRDGLEVMHFDNDKLINLALADMKLHLGVDMTPSEIRVSRWAEAFPQYRPHHFARLAELEHSLGAAAPGIVFAGGSYRGIGIPACVQQARAAGEATIAHLATLHS